MPTRYSKVLQLFTARGVLLLAVAILLAACSQRNAPNPQRESHNLSAATSPSLVPDPDALHLALAPGKLQALDFFTLSGCALQITIGKYQSALGRGASDSQRLLLDLEYLDLAPPCIEHLHSLGQTSLAMVIAEVQTLKREQLPAVIFNATLANTEFHQFWHHRLTHTIQPEQQQLSLSAIRAITALTRQWMAGDYRASNIEFEIYLNEIASGHLFYGDNLDATKHQRALVALEQQLHLVLPLEYKKWQAKRSHYFARHELPTKLD